MTTQLSPKQEFNNALEEVGGFVNWKLSHEAEALLDEENSVFWSYADNKYVLEGEYDGNFWRIRIYWEAGKQPKVEERHREPIQSLSDLDFTKNQGEVEHQINWSVKTYLTVRKGQETRESSAPPHRR